MGITGIFSESFWYVAPIIMSITVALAGAINGWLKVTSPVWKQVISWVIGSLLSVATYFLGFVQMGEPQWLGVVALCVVVGLSSNGIYDIKFIHEWINKLFPQSKLAKK